MNVASIPLHCLLTPSSSSSLSSSSSSSSSTVTLRSWLWALDTFFTGASSTAIVLATTTTTGGGDGGSIQDWFLITTMFGVVSIYAYMRYNNMTLPFELWYLVPTLYGAVPCTMFWLLRRKNTSSNDDDDDDDNLTAARQQRRTTAAFRLVTVHAVLLDRWICCAVTPSLLYLRCCCWDFWTSPAMVFFGSDLAFATLLSYLLVSTSSRVVVGSEMEEEMTMKPITTTNTGDSTTSI